MTDQSPTCCVVGSGPAGVACAQALLERGARVVMLDAGMSLEPDRAELVEQMRASPPHSWTASQLDQLKAGSSASARGIPLKLAYGSAFPYRGGEEHLAVEYDGVALRPSLARGGLSNVWGAAMLPFIERDTAEWPLPVSSLAPHYAAVLQLTGLSSRRDDLEGQFPLYHQQPAALEMSRQATLMLARMERHRERLQGSGISFGQARVAIQAPQPDRPGCCYCGICMYGCPYGYIYNSDRTVRELQRNPNFCYQPDMIVSTLNESAHGVRIDGQRGNGAPFEMETARVYLATGVIPTARILLRSRSVYDQTVWMRDSQYFLLPMVLTTRVDGVRAESLQTLCQLFLEVFDSAVGPHTVHLQIYSYNDLIGRAVRRMFGPLAPPLDALARNLEGRLLVVQGYLHSDHSARIGVTLRRGSPERLQLTARINPESKPMIRRVVRKLFRHARQLGAFPLSPILQVGKPGQGFHSGGTFPMSRNPQPFECDLTGRPHGWSRVHAVDATVLPSIPATTITFSVMANAHRIGFETV